MLRCDLCGKPVKPESAGQVTADTVLCKRCLRQAREQEGRNAAQAPQEGPCTCHVRGVSCDH